MLPVIEHYGVQRMESFKLRYFMVSVVAATGMVAAGWYASVFSRHLAEKIPVNVIKRTSFTFTSPLLDIELPEGYTIRREPIPFRHKVDGYVQQQTDGKQVRRISVYFRDLLDGPWFGINERYEFVPASMMKVPVLMAWLKRAETNPNILKQSFVYDGKSDATSVQHFKPSQTLQPYSGPRISDNSLRW